MTRNLGEMLRDAVDGPPPGLVGVVGEDPADVDLPAIGARVRRRRRARAATRSAVGVAAAGAVALAVPLAAGERGGGRVAAPLPGGTAVAASLCGTDVADLPVGTDDLRLAPTTATAAETGGRLVVQGGATDLGALVGRRLTAVLLADDGAATTGAQVALTRGTTVVALGGLGADLGSTADGATRARAVSADLVGCDGGEPAPGVYAVQLVVPGATGPTRSAAGPWLVSLLHGAAPATPLDGFPADEVPVVGGALAPVATSAEGDGWMVQVAVDGDDGLVRAADALRAAGADAPTPGDRLEVILDATTTAAPDLAALQAELEAADAALTEAQDEATALAGSGDVEALARTQADLAGAQARYQEAETALSDALAREATRATATYRFSLPSSFVATTRSWVVTVSASREGGNTRTVVEYLVTPR